MAMEQHSSFSASGEDVINRTIEVDGSAAADSIPHSLQDDFAAYYEIDRTLEEVKQGDYKRIALQFPDELLNDSVPIFRLLKEGAGGGGREFYVLADTSYGSCCVDEVAAQHVDADFMVHYGHACMSQTYRLPVLYVFGKKLVDIEDCVAQFADLVTSVASNNPSGSQKSVLFRHDVAHTYQADSIVRGLRRRLKPLGITVLYSEVPLRLDPPVTAHAGPTTASKDHPGTQSINEGTVEDCHILYLGGESLGLTNLLITHSSCEVYSYEPRNKVVRLESARTNRLLMRRYAVVQKAKDADVFGILVGTLGVAAYLPLISHVRSLLSRARKKSYTISVGKLNPAKLANFMEIECFVLIACPENSMIDAKDFLRPIVTPYELEVSLQAEQIWTGRYVLDFHKLLAENTVTSDSDTTKSPQSEEDPDQPIFSLITGQYRHAKRYGGETLEQDNTKSSAIILRNQDGALSKLPDSAAGHFLQSRTYQGLDTRLGQDAPSVLEQGRSGIARGYEDDHKEM